ncbi:MAG: hypothetical protein AAFT19_02690, partial [Pseudomonadota bacterium]
MRIPVPGIATGFVLVCLAVEILSSAVVGTLIFFQVWALEIPIDAPVGAFETAVTNSIAATLDVLGVLCAAAFTTRGRGFGPLAAANGLGRLSLALVALLRIVE